MESKLITELISKLSRKPIHWYPDSIRLRAGRAHSRR